MQHAEAHERLSDLALEPSRLARLEIDGAREAAELRAHVAACPTCAADLAGWRRTWAEAGAALAGEEPLDEITAPASLRARTLGAIREEASRGTVGRPGQPAAPRAAPGDGGLPAPSGAGRRLPWLVAAAAVVIAILGASFGLAGQAELTRLRAETAELETIAASFERILTAGDHWTVTLLAADGTPSGTLAWSRSEVVMVASGLPAPAAGQVYRCWVERDGARTAIGDLGFATSTGYWSAPMEAWGSGPWVRGTRFGVSLVAPTGSPTPVLVGTY